MVYGSVIRLPRQPAKLLCMPMYVHFIFSDAPFLRREVAFPTRCDVLLANAPRKPRERVDFNGTSAAKEARPFTLLPVVEEHRGRKL